MLRKFCDILAACKMPLQHMLQKAKNLSRLSTCSGHNNGIFYRSTVTHASKGRQFYYSVITQLQCFTTSTARVINATASTSCRPSTIGTNVPAASFVKPP